MKEHNKEIQELTALVKELVALVSTLNDSLKPQKRDYETKFKDKENVW
jgi:hypothetical protein